MSAEVLLTVSGVIDPARAEQIASGTRPGADYLDMARVFGADLVDLAEARRETGLLGKLVEKVTGPYLLLAWICFLRRRRYKVIFTDGEQVGIPLALLFKLTGWRRTRHLMIAHILSVGKKKLFFDRFGIQSHIDIFFVYSTWQKQFIETRWKVASERVVWTPFMVDSEFFALGRVTPEPRPQICAVGLEFRDYPTLLEAVRGLDLDVVIAAASPWSRRDDTTAGQEIPSNVRVQRFSQYELRQVYADSRFMVMPLYDVNFQAGVTAILEAMAMERAVICSRTAGQTDVIVDRETGLYVPTGDPLALRAAIERLWGDPREAERMGRAGRQRVEQEMSLDRYVDRLNEYVQAALRGAGLEQVRSKMNAAGEQLPPRPVRVLHYLSTIGMGGLENYVLTLCRYLDRDEIRPMITCITENRPEIAEHAAAMNVPVDPIQPPPPGMLQRRLAYLVRMVRLVALLRRHQVDVLHIHAIGYNGLNAIVAALLARRPKIVVTHHQQLPPRPHGWGEQAVLWLQKRTKARIIALFSAQAGDIAATGIARPQIGMVPTAVDLRVFQGAGVRRQNDPSIFRLCMAARFQDGKGHEHLIEAVGQLLPRYPQLRLLLIGDGETRSRIEELIRRRGLGDVVELAGWVPNARMPEVVGTADATVLPTYIPTETTPIALLEGMALGLPAIGTRWGGLPDMIVEGETGFLVEPEDVSSLATAIEALVKDPARAAEMGRRAQERVQRVFSGESLARTMSEIYRALAARD